MSFSDTIIMKTEFVFLSRYPFIDKTNKIENKNLQTVKKSADIL